MIYFILRVISLNCTLRMLNSRITEFLQMGFLIQSLRTTIVVDVEEIVIVQDSQDTTGIFVIEAEVLRTRCSLITDETEAWIMNLTTQLIEDSIIMIIINDITGKELMATTAIDLLALMLIIIGVVLVGIYIVKDELREGDGSIQDFQRNKG
jgi:hypothetical protein